MAGWKGTLSTSLTTSPATSPTHSRNVDAIALTGMRNINENVGDSMGGMQSTDSTVNQLLTLKRKQKQLRHEIEIACLVRETASDGLDASERKEEERDAAMSARTHRQHSHPAAQRQTLEGAWGLGERRMVDASARRSYSKPPDSLHEHLHSQLQPCPRAHARMQQQRNASQEGNLVTVDARVIAQMLQREQQLVAVLAEHAHADGEHSTGYAGDDY
jgi:hypothetical protein